MDTHLGHAEDSGSDPGFQQSNVSGRIGQPSTQAAECESHVKKSGVRTCITPDAIEAGYTVSLTASQFNDTTPVTARHGAITFGHFGVEVGARPCTHEEVRDPMCRGAVEECDDRTHVSETSSESDGPFPSSYSNLRPCGVRIRIGER